MEIEIQNKVLLCSAVIAAIAMARKQEEHRTITKVDQQQCPRVEQSVTNSSQPRISRYLWSIVYDAVSFPHYSAAFSL